MFNFSKKILFLIAIVSVSSVFGVPTKKTPKKKYYDQGYKIEKHTFMQAYNTPARVNVNGCRDLFVEGSFIYWRPQEKGLTIGATSSSDLATQQVEILNLDTRHKSGFKVGVGGHSNFDDWSVLAQYTRFNRDSKDSYERSLAFTPDWLTQEGNIVEALWNLDFNLFDLEISRPNFTGKHLILSPLAGITGGWINQRYEVSNVSSIAKSFSDSWLIGPKAGIKSFWQLRGDFKFLGEIEAAIFYQDFYKISYEERSALNNAFFERATMVKHYLIPNLNLGAGLAFGSYFYKDKWHIDILGKYEFSYFWNQNQMRYLLNQLKFTRFNAGSLMLQGITASLRLDF